MLTTAILFATYGSNNGRLLFWSAAGVVFGIVLFFRGFHMLRFKRLILNTPESKIRSASMGLVEVTGTARGPFTIPAGVTGDPCFYYRAMAWQLRQSGRNSHWTKVADESLYVPFFLDDSTGRMLVDPQGAELDIHRNFKDQFNSSFFSNRDLVSANRNLPLFLARNGISGGEDTRIEEYCIKPDYSLFVFGTLQTNPLRGDWKPVAHLGSGISLKSRLNPFGPASNLAMQILGVSMGIQAQKSLIDPAQVRVSGAAASTSASAGAAASVQPHPAAAAPAARASTWSSISMDEDAMAAVGPALARHAASAAPLPAARPAISAVAVAEPVAKPAAAASRPPVPPVAPAPAPPAADAHQFEMNPSAAIAKGASGAPFAISCKSQREVVRELAWKSGLCIWGGPALTLASLLVLLATLGAL